MYGSKQCHWFHCNGGMATVETTTAEMIDIQPWFRRNVFSEKKILLAGVAAREYLANQNVNPPMMTTNWRKNLLTRGSPSKSRVHFINRTCRFLFF